MTRSGESRGRRISQSMRLKLAEKVREQLRLNPLMSILALVKKTGAPFGMAGFIKKQFTDEREREAKAAAP